MNENTYDLAIIGGGPAGLTAAIYGKRYGLNTVVLSDSFGGMMSTAHKICNYPGFNEIAGMDLSQKMIDQVTSLEVEIVFEKVIDVVNNSSFFVVNTDQRTIKAKKVILAIGRARRKLNIKREEELTGKGVSYCATCDAGFYKEKVVGVIGGSDAAVTAAIMLSEIAKKVYIIYRKDQLRAEKVWVDQVNNNKKIEVLYNQEVKELLGKEKLEKIKLLEDKELDVDGIFIEIGSIPNTELLKKIAVEIDENGYIKVNKDQKTNVSGIYACGDSTNSTTLKQVVTACSQGAICAYNCYLDIKENK
jgi:thioredoxin reductase (NADPH)